jgi:hypothetical protein
LPFVQDPPQVTEVGQHGLDFESRKPSSRLGNGLRIAIQGQDPAAGRHSLGHPSRVAASAQSPIHSDLTRLQDEPLQNFLGQHRNVYRG